MHFHELLLPAPPIEKPIPLSRGLIVVSGSLSQRHARCICCRSTDDDCPATTTTTNRYTTSRASPPTNFALAWGRWNSRIFFECSYRHGFLSFGRAAIFYTIGSAGNATLLECESYADAVGSDKRGEEKFHFKNDECSF